MTPECSGIRTGCGVNGRARRAQALFGCLDKVSRRAQSPHQRADSQVARIPAFQSSAPAATSAGATGGRGRAGAGGSAQGVALLLLPHGPAPRVPGGGHGQSRTSRHCLLASIERSTGSRTRTACPCSHWATGATRRPCCAIAPMIMSTCAACSVSFARRSWNKSGRNPTPVDNVVYMEANQITATQLAVDGEVVNAPNAAGHCGIQIDRRRCAPSGTSA